MNTPWFNKKPFHAWKITCNGNKKDFTCTHKIDKNKRVTFLFKNRNILTYNLSDTNREVSVLCQHLTRDKLKNILNHWQEGDVFTPPKHF